MKKRRLRTFAAVLTVPLWRGHRKTTQSEGEIRRSRDCHGSWWPEGHGGLGESPPPTAGAAAKAAGGLQTGVGVCGFPSDVLALNGGTGNYNS